jgi:hypothetical protein
VSLESDLIQINTEINNLRQLEYIIRSPEFQEAYKNATSKQEPHYYISVRDCDALRSWIGAQKLQDLEAYTVRALRLMARDLKVRDYHLLTKSDLIREIKTCRAVQL